MKYLLMNKDKVIGEFEFIQKQLGVKAVINETLNKDISNISSSIGNWLKTRKVPKNREFVSNLLREWNLNDDEIYVQLSHAISLNDTLWVKQEDENLTWLQVNPYVNELDDVIAHYAFTGEGLGGVQFNTTSPELGTNGMLPKCWKRYGINNIT